MKLKFTIIFVLFSSAGICQNGVVTKHQLSKLFKGSINQEAYEGDGAWTICNQDSAFFKSDTIKLYNEINYFYQISSCCKFIQWTFYKKKTFVQSELQICKEPSTGSVIDRFRKSYTIKYFTDSNELYLYVLKPKEMPQFFKVISIQEIKLAHNNTTKVIVLKRLMSRQPIIGTVY